MSQRISTRVGGSSSTSSARGTVMSATSSSLVKSASKPKSDSKETKEQPESSSGKKSATSAARPPITRVKSNQAASMPSATASSSRVTPRIASARRSTLGAPISSSNSKLAPTSSAALVSESPTPPRDPLTSLTTPLLYLILAHSSIAEICCLTRVSRLLFDITSSERHAKLVWKQRCMQRLQADLVYAKSRPSRPTSVPKYQDDDLVELPQRLYKHWSHDLPKRAVRIIDTKITERVDEKALTRKGIEFYQHIASSSPLARITSLPPTSPYRTALLHSLRAIRRTKYEASLRSQAAANDIAGRHVTRPLMENLNMSYLLSLTTSVQDVGNRLSISKKHVNVAQHDHAVTLSWMTDGTITWSQLKGIQILAYSKLLMKEVEMGDVETSMTREFVCLHSASNAHSLSLLEWRVKSQDPKKSNRRLNETQTLPIPGMELMIYVGVWGAVNSVSSSYSSSSSSSSSSPLVYPFVSSSSTSSAHEIAFIWVTIPHVFSISRTVSPLTMLNLAPRAYSIVADDIQSNYGQHGYHVGFAIRSVRKTIGSWSWRELCADPVTSINSTIPTHFNLRFPSSVSSVLPPWNSLPSLPWRTPNFNGRFERFVILDFIIRHESRLLCVVSAPVELKLLDGASGAGEVVMDVADEQSSSVQYYGAKYPIPNVGGMRIELAHVPTNEEAAALNTFSSASSSTTTRSSSAGRTWLHSLSFSLSTSFIDSRFSTAYLSTGYASAQQALRREMKEWSEHDAQEIQMREWGLRPHVAAAVHEQQEDERPLDTAASRSAAATARRRSATASSSSSSSVVQPGVRVVRRSTGGPAAVAASAASSSASASASSSSSSSSTSRAPCVRPQWQDVEPPRDEDEGFKF